MAILSLIFVAILASVVSAAPQSLNYPVQELTIDYSDHVIIPWVSMPEYEYEIIYEGQSGGASNGNNNGNGNVPPSKTCRPSEAQKNVPGMDAWCNSNCFHNPPYCPESHCQCF